QRGAVRRIEPRPLRDGAQQVLRALRPHEYVHRARAQELCSPRGVEEMAAHGWGKSASVKEWLVAEAHRFDFYQAVALIEHLVLPKKGAPAPADLEHDTAVRPVLNVGEGPEPAWEAVRFKSTISLAFPETDVDAIEEPDRGDGKRFTMKVNFMS